MSFWKKLLLLFPLLIIRVIGKVLIKIFGLKALERLFKRYGLLERRYKRLLSGINVTRTNVVARWTQLSRTTKAHLILAFLPILTLIALAALIIKLLRFRLLQLFIEKLMQKGVQEKVQKGVETASVKLLQKKSSNQKPSVDASDSTNRDSSKPE